MHHPLIVAATDALFNRKSKIISRVAEKLDDDFACLSRVENFLESSTYHSVGKSQLKSRDFLLFQTISKEKFSAWNYQNGRSFVCV